MENLTFSILEFHLEFDHKMDLPTFPAKTIRGGLGYAMREILCFNNGCTRVQHKEDCEYPDLFDEKKGAYLPDYVGYVRPFLIKIEKVENQKLTIRLHLFGKWVEKFHYFIAAFVQFGQKGMGYGQQKFSVVKVDSIHLMGYAKRLYNGNRDQIIGNPFAVASREIKKMLDDIDTNQVEMEFLTLVRLQVEGRYVSSFTFKDLIENLLRRYRSLLYFHEEQKKIDSGTIDELIDLSLDIEVVSSNLGWDSYTRYSTRQNQKIEFDGFTGTVEYYGNLRPFLYLLVLGQYFHVGKQSAFGLGKYKVTFE